MSLDNSTNIIASEHLSESATSDGQLHITMNIGIISTTNILFDTSLRLTTKDGDDVSPDLCIFTRANNLTQV